MAEGEGFEPPVRFPVQWLSRPPVSTAHASLRRRAETLSFHLVYLCFRRRPNTQISSGSTAQVNAAQDTSEMTGDSNHKCRKQRDQQPIRGQRNPSTGD